jgi:hypothetical protein
MYTGGMANPDPPDDAAIFAATAGDPDDLAGLIARYGAPAPLPVGSHTEAEERAAYYLTLANWLRARGL